MKARNSGLYSTALIVAVRCMVVLVLEKKSAIREIEAEVENEYS
jgi:hypothetical protein